MKGKLVQAAAMAFFGVVAGGLVWAKSKDIDAMNARADKAAAKNKRGNGNDVDTPPKP